MQPKCNRRALLLGEQQFGYPFRGVGCGLYGCHYTFDTDTRTDSQTAITVPANLHPDGWNVDCLTGETTPGTNAAAAGEP